MAENKPTHVYSPMELRGLSKYFSLIFHRSLQRAVWSFAELGIADLINEHKSPISAVELSQLNGNNWNAKFLYRVLRLIVDMGIVQISNDKDQNFDNDRHPEKNVRFQLTDDGLLLLSSHPAKLRDVIRSDLSPMYDRASMFLPALIQSGYKNGDGFQQAFQCSFFDYFQKEENKEACTQFNNCMTGYSSYMISSMLPVVDFSRFKVLVDVAGALGTVLAAVLEKHQNLHGILFDLSHIIEEAKTNNPNEFQLKNIDPKRYEFVSGDMFKSETIPQADAYMMKHIIHDWNDEKAVEILKAIRDANRHSKNKTITVFIIEMVIFSDGKDDWAAHTLDLEMLINLSAQERTIAEYTDLFNKANFKIKQIYKTTSNLSVIETETTIDN